MPIVTYTNSPPGTIIDCFLVSGSLANWLTQKVRLIEGAAPNTGRWTGSLSAGSWEVFEGGSQPASFDESVGTFIVEEDVTSPSSATTLDGYYDSLVARRAYIVATLADTTNSTLGGKPNLLTKDGGHAIDHVKWRLSLYEELREIDKLILAARSVQDAIDGEDAGLEIMTQTWLGG